MRQSQLLIFLLCIKAIDLLTKPLPLNCFKLVLRLIRYPAQAGAIDEKIGTGTHSDYECFTILAQNHVGGLQVLNSAGKQILAIPIPKNFVVNIGDQMARWTNDLFRSTVHRAVNRSLQERYSIPYFFGCNYDTSIEGLPSYITFENPAKYQPVTTGEYIISHFNEICAYRKNESVIAEAGRDCYCRSRNFICLDCIGLLGWPTASTLRLHSRRLPSQPGRRVGCQPVPTGLACIAAPFKVSATPSKLALTATADSSDRPIAS